MAEICTACVVIYAAVASLALPIVSLLFWMWVKEYQSRVGQYCLLVDTQTRKLDEAREDIKRLKEHLNEQRLRLDIRTLKLEEIARICGKKDNE